MSKFLLLLFFSACTPETDAPPAEPELPQIWVASQPIEVGTPVTRDRLEQRRMAWLHPEIEPLALDEIEGRVARERLTPGVPVRDERLAPAEAGSTLAAIIPDGMRIVTVPVTTVAGFYASQFVDVYTDTDGPDVRAITILKVYPPTADQPPAVKVAVTPQQARTLATPATRSLALLTNTDITNITTHGSIELRDADLDLPADPAGSEVSFRTVARRDLYPGVTIGEKDIVAIPAPGWVQTPSVEEVVRRIPASRIFAGEAIHPSYLTGPVAGIGLASVMPRGMQGVFLPVSRVQRLDLKPGDYVDIFAAGSSEPVLLAQALFVLSNHPATDYGAAHLGVLVAPSQAKKILRAGHEPGNQFLAAVRNPQDVKRLDMP